MNTPAATAEPITPATFGPMACISRKLLGFSCWPTFWETRAAIGTAVATLVGNVFLMNRYYYKHIGLNIPGFWRRISHLLPAMVLPTTVAVLLAASWVA